jgi:hypothetical protein
MLPNRFSPESVTLLTYGIILKSNALQSLPAAAGYLPPAPAG